MTAPGSHQLLPEQLLISLFGLSRSEARLATLLVEGLKLAEAAGAMNISEGSARIYCKRIFSKMGVGRQVELVKMVLKSVASLSRSQEEQPVSLPLAKR
jgi:DNA-binding CsgD family transcriptional regulator